MKQYSTSTRRCLALCAPSPCVSSRIAATTSRAVGSFTSGAELLRELASLGCDGDGDDARAHLDGQLRRRQAH